MLFSDHIFSFRNRADLGRLRRQGNKNKKKEVNKFVFLGKVWRKTWRFTFNLSKSVIVLSVSDVVLDHIFDLWTRSFSLLG